MKYMCWEIMLKSNLFQMTFPGKVRESWILSWCCTKKTGGPFGIRIWINNCFAILIKYKDIITENTLGLNDSVKLAAIGNHLKSLGFFFSSEVKFFNLVSIQCRWEIILTFHRCHFWYYFLPTLIWSCFYNNLQLWKYI